MSTSISASEARASLPHLLDRVEAGDEVTITRHGQPVAVLIRVDAVRVRRADAALAVAAEIRQALADARRRPLAATGGPSAARADELVAEVASGRARR